MRVQVSPSLPILSGLSANWLGDLILSQGIRVQLPLGLPNIMPKSNNRKNLKLHCQKCAKPRKMLSFHAINLDDKEHKTTPLVFREFIEKVKSDTMVKMPQYYFGICGQCLTETFYKAHQNGKSLDVVCM
jgi:hypothetical protein